MHFQDVVEAEKKTMIVFRGIRLEESLKSI